MSAQTSNDIEKMRTVGIHIADTLGIKTISDSDARLLAHSSTRWLEVFGLGETIENMRLSQASNAQMVIGEIPFGNESRIMLDALKVPDGVMVRGSITSTREDLLIRQVSLYTTFAENGELLDTRCRMVLNTTRGPRYVTLLQPKNPKGSQTMDLRFTNEYDAEVDQIPVSLKELPNLTIQTLPQFLGQVVKEFE